jgi:hypothetical protein
MFITIGEVMKKKSLSMFIFAFLAMNGALFAQAEVAKAEQPKKSSESVDEKKWITIPDGDEVVQAEEENVEAPECGGCKKG